MPSQACHAIHKHVFLFITLALQLGRPWLVPPPTEVHLFLVRDTRVARHLSKTLPGETGGLAKLACSALLSSEYTKSCRPLLIFREAQPTRLVHDSTHPLPAGQARQKATWPACRNQARMHTRARIPVVSAGTVCTCMGWTAPFRLAQSMPCQIAHLGREGPHQLLTISSCSNASTSTKCRAK